MNKQVMRLNQTVYCDGCGTMVNPYVIERKPDSTTLECPSCEHSWTEQVPQNFDDAA